MSLPAGLFIILAVAASWAGWWLLAAVVLAGCLAWVARRSTPRGRVGELLAAVREWLLFVVSVTVPAAYLASAPTSVGTAEVAYLAVVAGVVLVAVAADALGANSSDRTSRWPVVLFGVAAAAFVAVCLAIPPAPQPITDSDPFSPFGLLVATTVVLPLLMGLYRVRLRSVAGVVLVAVAADALGANSSDRTSRWPVVLFGVAAAAFVAVCLAIPPAPQPITDSDPFSPFGLLVATTVVLPWLMGLDRVRL